MRAVFSVDSAHGGTPRLIYTYNLPDDEGVTIGEDIYFVVEICNDRGEWFCVGEFNGPFRDSEKFRKIKDKMCDGIPPNASIEAESELKKKCSLPFMGKEGEMRNIYYDTGSLDYTKFMKIMKKGWFDPYNPKYHDKMRIVCGFSWRGYHED